MANFAGYNERRIPAWDEVLSALRGGHYPQGYGAMCEVTETDTYAPSQPVGAKFDALGIINDLAGADWELHAGDNACDDDGETEVPGDDILGTLGLDREVYPSELKDARYGEAFKYMWRNILEVEEAPRRIDVIAFLNDELGGHAAVADEVERLGWNGRS
jgi:hypothetical protein